MNNVRYAEQFKRDAVRLVVEEGYSAKAAAEAVGVCPTTMRSWVSRHGAQMKQRTRFALLQDELDHLCNENARLGMECEIPKKATAFAQCIEIARPRPESISIRRHART